MSLMGLAQMQRAARKEGYGVPHFLGSNIEMTIAAITAAEEMRSPLALGFAPEVFSMIPMEYALPMMVSAAERASVPISVQLEHGSDYETIARAISLGMGSVMFDGSELSFEENIEKTKEIVKMAHAFGVDVEAELGYVGGSALTDKEGKESRNTNPALVPEFIEKTGIDSLAISFGNFHGKYKAPPVLDYSLVEAVTKLTDIPLTMHGGSGLCEEEYKSAIRSGISNIHFYTYTTLDLWSHLEKVAEAADYRPVYHNLCRATIEYFTLQTKRAMKMLGSAGRAK